MGKLKVFTAEHHNPFFNLATEDWLFKSFEPNHQVLFLWRNDPCIVIGRYQNPWSECNIQAMQKDGILLARRQSGGGAVYHDLGNTNFTFMSPKDSYHKEANFSIISQALRSFGLEAHQSGRNDILVEGKKISGSAFRLTSDRAFHHGTLLINADIGKLLAYLTPDKDKLQSKGIRSVASRVANLSEFNDTITHESLSYAIIQAFFSYYQAECPVEDLTIEALEKEDTLYETYQTYADWSWRFGSTPQFSHPISSRFSWGGITLDVLVKEGRIEHVTIFSDTVCIELVELLEEVLPGIPYDIEHIRLALLTHTSATDEEMRIMISDVVGLLEKEFSD